MAATVKLIITNLTVAPYPKPGPRLPKRQSTKRVPHPSQSSGIPPPNAVSHQIRGSAWRVPPAPLVPSCGPTMCPQRARSSDSCASSHDCENRGLGEQFAFGKTHGLSKTRSAVSTRAREPELGESAAPALLEEGNAM